MGLYFGRWLDEPLFLFKGGDHGYLTQGLLFIALSVTNQQIPRFTNTVPNAGLYWGQAPSSVDVKQSLNGESRKSRD